MTCYWEWENIDVIITHKGSSHFRAGIRCPFYWRLVDIWTSTLLLLLHKALSQRAGPCFLYDVLLYDRAFTRSYDRTSYWILPNGAQVRGRTRQRQGNLNIALKQRGYRQCTKLTRIEYCIQKSRKARRENQSTDVYVSPGPAELN